MVRHEHLDRIPQVLLLAGDGSRRARNCAPGVGDWPQADVAGFCFDPRHRRRHSSAHSTPNTLACVVPESP